MIATHPEGVLISLHVIPGAPKNEIIGRYNNCLKIKINAPPVDGKANTAIEEFIASVFKVAKRNVHVLKGERSKTKKVLIQSLAQSQIEKILSVYL